MAAINLKDIPSNIHSLILDKQLEFTKQKGHKVNLAQTVIIMLRDGYLRAEPPNKLNT